MKKRNVLSIVILALFPAFIMVSATLKPDSNKPKEIPAEVNAVVQQKCFGCHNTDSRNDKAKEKLEFDRLDSLSIVERVGKFTDIEKELNEGKMPPPKFLERFPDRALTADEKKILIEWAKNGKKNLK